MMTELPELLSQLQGHWKLDNNEQNFEINGENLTLFSHSKPVKSSFELIKNLQLGNWQIKSINHVSWQRTFIVKLTPDTLMLYDFDVKVQVAMAGRSRLLNPTRIYNYSRVTEVPVA